MYERLAPFVTSDRDLITQTYAAAVIQNICQDPDLAAAAVDSAARRTPPVVEA